MKIKNAFSIVLFFSFLFVTTYCFCQYPQQSTNNKIKAQTTPATPTSVVSPQKQSPIENPVKSDAAKKSQVNKETATGIGEPGILRDVKRVTDEHPQESPTLVASAQKPSPIENPLKSGAVKKSQVNNETGTGRGETSILQDVKRILDEHPQESSNNKIKAEATPTTPASIASTQKQPSIENPVKSDAAKKSQVIKETATGKGETGILQDVKRVSDAHP
ncbi:MAG: hypothetical protein JWQ40_4480 [Segetibacter sp.]|nr:hypothetical protein [Segetibacter sp.]